MALLTAIFSGFLLALAAPWLHAVLRNKLGWLLAVLPLCLTIYFAAQIDRVASGEVPRVSVGWLPSLGIQLSFRVDGLSLLFAILISGIGTLILIYAGGYLAGHRQLGRFYAFLLSFMAAMLGLVLADNVMTLFAFWELTSISSYMLIGFDHQRGESRAAALQALLVTGGGGLALLAGLLLLGQIGGSMELSVLLERGDLIRADRLYLAALLLLLLGAFTKSAQFPFHFWLPSAMEAPTPVSAYLHSATMVKAGIYLLARISPAMAGTAAWSAIVTTIGTVTMLAGGYLAIQSTDMKRLLAYSTISALGTLTLLLGLGSSGAVQAAMVFLLAHALYKAALFMIAGTVDHETGTRDATQLGGLWRSMPMTTIAALMAALSLAGLAPFVSFIGKELLLEATWTAEAWFLLTPAAIVGGALFVAVAAIFVLRVFFGKAKPTPKHPHEAPPSFWLGPIFLTLCGLAVGLFPQWIGTRVVAPSIAAILAWPQPYPEQVKLALWHGVNAALIFSIISIVLGLALYVVWEMLRQFHSRLAILQYGPSRAYGRAVEGTFALAARVEGVLQNGYLRYYMTIVFATFFGLVGCALLGGFGIEMESLWDEVRLYEALLAGLILLAAFAAVRASTRFAAVVSMGVVGYSLALVFTLFGAPDLAITQFMVETLTVILFVFVLYRLPSFKIASPRTDRIRDGVIAVAVGSLVTTLVLAALHVPQAEPVSHYYAEKSYSEAHGKNVVNVILVDFRAFDTMGEITVLAVAAVGVYALMKLGPETGEETG